MNTNFECLKCHHKFVADDSLDVSCPHCGSDNVRPVGKSLSRPLLFAGVFIVAFAIGFMAIRMIKGPDTDHPVTHADVSDSESSYPSEGQESVTEGSALDIDEEAPKSANLELQEKKIAEDAKKIAVNQPVTIAISTPKADEAGTYSFVVKAEHLPAGVKVNAFTLTDVDGAKAIATSTNGRFSGIPASAEKGQYTIMAELSNGEIVTRDRIGGFDKVEVVDNRIKSEELTELLNSRNKELGLGKNPKVIRKPKIVINNSTDENDRQVTLIDDIYSRLEFGSWSRVTVTSVEYDSQGRVNKFAIDKHN